MSANEDLSQQPLHSHINPKSDELEALSRLKSAYGMALEQLSESQAENTRLKDEIGHLAKHFREMFPLILELLQRVLQRTEDELETEAEDESDPGLDDDCDPENDWGLA